MANACELRAASDEIVHVDSPDPQIAGWYVVDQPNDTTPDQWTWTSRGAGPEIDNDGVWGPFESEKAAEEWATAREAECE